MIRGVLTLVTFVVTTSILGLIAILGALLSGQPNFVLAIGKLWARAHMAVMGITPVYHGLEHAGGTAPRIFLANHVSNLDIWAVVPALPVTTRFVSKRTIFWIPILGQAMKAAEFIPIDRKDRASAIRSLGHAAERIRGGASVILFPEGTRSRDGKLAAFKRGAFHLALDAGVPIVPIAISGTYHVLRPRSIVVRRWPVHVTFAPPIDVTAYAGDPDALLTKVREEIAARLPAEQLGTS